VKSPISPQLDDIAPKLVVAISLLAGFLSLLFSGFFWARFRIDIPVEDTISLLPLVQSVVETGWTSITLQEWIAPHASAHRIAVGRLLMAADYNYLAGDNSLFYLGSWLSIATLCYLYFNSARLSRPLYTHVPLFMLGMALIYTCSYTLTRNLVSPINSLWYISAACSALSIYLFTVPGKKLTVLRAAAACLLSIIAAYTTFLGVISALVLVLIAIQSRSRHSLWVTPLLLIFVALYMRDIRTVAEVAADNLNAAGGAHVTQLEVLFNFKEQIFDFIIVFLSAPISKSPTLLSYFYVIPSVCLILFGWVMLARQWFTAQPESSSVEKFYLAMATVFLGTALACSLGRTGFNEPAAARYQTIVMLYWLSVGGLLIYQVRNLPQPGVKTGSMLLLLLIPMGLLYHQSAFELKPVVQKSLATRNIELSTRMGVSLFKDPRYADAMHSSQYLKFEDFLAQNTRMGATARHNTNAGLEVTRECDAMRLERVPRRDLSPMVKGIKLTVEDAQLQRFREVRLSRSDGGWGYLQEKTPEQASVSNLVWGKTTWIGYYSGGDGPSSYILVFDSILGPDYRCRLNTES
jgi:hypothetical protein